MTKALEEALLEISEEEAATAIATTGAAEEASDLMTPLGDESLEADAHAPLAAMDYTPNTRQSKMLTTSLQRQCPDILVLQVAEGLPLPCARLA